MAKRKVLIAGATGQVGTAVNKLFAKNDKNELFTFTHKDLDISSRDMVSSVVYTIKPDVIINAAAMTNVDLCESEFDNAFNINSLGVRNLTQSAQEINSHLIHLSTDFVFDGQKKSPYSEFDIPNPQSIYALSKLGGDTEALKYEKSTVLRVAWVFGNPNGDFFSWVYDGYKNNTIKTLISDAQCTPTYSDDIAMVIDHVVSNQNYGLLNVANSNVTTRLEMGQLFLKKLGIDFMFDAVTSETLNRPALRPLYSALSTTTLKAVTGIELRSWQEALDDHLRKFI